MFHNSYIEISKSALAENYNFLRKVYGKIPFSSVVKGNAYGHGIEQFVTLAQSLGQTHFSVYSADEALRIVKCCHRLPTILIMGMIDNHQIAWAVEHGIEFYVFELSRLEAAIAAAKKLNKKAIIHLEIETGMNRTGFVTDDLVQAVSLIKANENQLELKGFCTHFAGAESISNHIRVQQQKKIYLKSKRWLESKGLQATQYHSTCSAASLRMPEMRMDLVRVGILQYGFWPSREIFIEHVIKKNKVVDPLKRLISWKTSIMSTKHVKTGEYIGYGSSFLAQADLKIATVPVGYAHGYDRKLSNSGRALVRGLRVGIIGLINMNALVLDITEVPEVEKGDEVVLIGKQGKLEITVSSFGEMSEQLNYELLTRLSADIPRKIIN